jgi:hypothetical protein
MKVVRSSALRTGRPYTQEIFLVLIYSRPQGHSAAGRIMSIKNPVTRLGIEPATFRLVAQCLNHYATACPNLKSVGLFILLAMLCMYVFRTVGTSVNPGW